jgi:DNA modification methylase
MVNYQVLNGDVRQMLKKLPEKSIQCCVTSPPYFGLRDYGTGEWDGGDPACDHHEQRGGRNPETSSKQITNKGTIFTQFARACGKCGAVRKDKQIGLEATPEEFVRDMVDVFREVRRVLRDDGTLWLNLGDSYCGSGINDGTVNPGISNDAKRGGIKGERPTRIFRSGSIRADGIVTDESPRNRNGVGPVPGIKPKDLIGIPWMVAFALRTDGWYLRSDIIWHKPNPMPESVMDRPTKSHEYLFLLTKSNRYYYDMEAIKENTDSEPDVRLRASTFKKKQELGHCIGTADREHPEDAMVETVGRNKRSVWSINTQCYKGAHFATFPEKLVEPCILAGTSEHGACAQGGAAWARIVSRGESKQIDPSAKTTGWKPTCDCGTTDVVPCIVLDTFTGSGTTGVVAIKNHRRFIGTELNPVYAKLATNRMDDTYENPLW